MYFHIILTDDCNLCCRYCRAKAFEAEDEVVQDQVPVEIDEKLAPDLDYDPALLCRFLARDPVPSVTFYGGEPLLRPALIERIVREAPVQRFMIQTNGLLLDRSPRRSSTGSPRFLSRWTDAKLSPMKTGVPAFFPG